MANCKLAKSAFKKWVEGQCSGRILPLSIEVVSKPHLSPNGCVVQRIEMLTYLRVRSASNTLDALPLNLN